MGWGPWVKSKERMGPLSHHHPDLTEARNQPIPWDRVKRSPLRLKANIPPPDSGQSHLLYTPATSINTYAYQFPGFVPWKINCWKEKSFFISSAITFRKILSQIRVERTPWKQIPAWPSLKDSCMLPTRPSWLSSYRDQVPGSQENKSPARRCHGSERQAARILLIGWVGPCLGMTILSSAVSSRFCISLGF